MAPLYKLTSERSQAFHRIGSLYIELSTLKAGSPEYLKIAREIADLKLQVAKLQRQIVLARMKKADRFFKEMS